MTDVGLNAVLEYLSDEVEAAETKEELMFVLALVRELFNPNSLQNAVVGLNNIRAEIDCQAIANAGAKRGKTNQSGAKRSETVQANSIPTGPTLAGETRECTVQLDVPQILSSTFQQLSERMRTLQSDDPDTFANATSALTWLASGTIRTN
jgi:hypothetical protein